MCPHDFLPFYQHARHRSRETVHNGRRFATTAEIKRRFCIYRRWAPSVRPFGWPAVPVYSRVRRDGPALAVFDREGAKRCFGQSV